MPHKVLLLIGGLLVSSMPVPSLAAPLLVTGEDVTVGHGGGCRKSSPPGQCCHMQNSTGTVHCH